MKLREEFVLEALSPGANKAELCRRFGVSRKTAYKWLERFRERGVAGLSDLSRRPHRSPLRASGEAVLAVIAARQKHPGWGARKLRELVARKLKDDEVPSVRTIARIVDRAGLVEPRRRRTPPIARPTGAPQVERERPNDLWTMDFKGWWRTRDGERCEPLTVRDAASRYVLCAEALGGTGHALVRAALERVFDAYGLPRAIQVDNGPPFASTHARGGLTVLSAWWVSLGIRVVRGRPAHPEDNGGHERMHRDVRKEVQRRPASNRARQQHELERWRHEFNCVRPHEALEMLVPAALYERSPRRHTGPRTPFYEPGIEVRKVSVSGTVNYDGSRIRIGRGLRAQLVGLQRVDDDTVRIRFFDVDLGEAKLDRTAA